MRVVSPTHAACRDAIGDMPNTRWKPPYADDVAWARNEGGTNGARRKVVSGKWAESRRQKAGGIDQGGNVHEMAPAR
jgi:hypothetical protein